MQRKNSKRKRPCRGNPRLLSTGRGNISGIARWYPLIRPRLAAVFSTSNDIRCISIDFYTSGYDDKYHAITAISGTESVGKARSPPTRTLAPNANTWLDDIVMAGLVLWAFSPRVNNPARRRTPALTTLRRVKLDS